MNMFELGKQYKCSEDRLSLLSTLVSANYKLLSDLSPLNLVSKEESHVHLRCILCLCRQDLDGSFELALGDNGVEVTMEHLVTSMLNLRSNAEYVH